MDELRPGTLVAGRYSVLRLLGRGATKQVYLADDRLFGAPVALALLLPRGITDPTMAARFSREGRAASVLRSPFVVRVFDVGKLPDGTRYLATEAVLGRSLDQVVEQGPVEPEKAAQWAIHVLAGLTEAHTRGILHRDVKPENVLLAPTQHGEVAKLTDFGLAKVQDVALEGSIALRTAQNVVLGTPDYMSPEQWRGGPIDARADVYSVGVMLYEMLTGVTPFHRNVMHAIFAAAMTEEPPAFPTTLSDAARALEPVVRRALAKRPDARFASAEAMRAAIESVTGERLHSAWLPDAALPKRAARAELVSDVWPGAIVLVGAPDVVLGRGEAAHVRVMCLPLDEDNRGRTQTISRQHARIEWRGGRAMMTDLGSRTGTRVRGRAIGTDSVELRNGEEIQLGRYVKLTFEHAPASPGELPRWARLTRTDEFGSGQVFVLVLTEAKFSAGPDAAVRLPAQQAAGDVLRVRVVDDGFAVVPLGALEPVPLRDGATLRVGSVKISVATA